MSEPLLVIDGLEVGFTNYGRRVRVLDDVSLSVSEGERVALIGQSGSGKSVTMRAIIGTLPMPPADIGAGSIRFAGTNLLALARRERERRKGEGLSIVLQDPLLSFNPVLTIGRQMDDVVRYADARAGRSRTRGARRAHLIETLRRVQLADGVRVLDAWPMQLSGGMRQRVLIATALLNGPRLLIADEPGTALDVTTQWEILELLDGLVANEGLSLLLITHNLGVVREASDRVYVMQHGRIVESARCDALFAAPEADYTRRLMESVPPLFGERVRRLPEPVRNDSLLVLDGVTREFRERRGLFGRETRSVRAVDAVSLRVRHGEIFGIAGESGSGKTTLARMVLGLPAPSSGTLLLGEEPIPLAGGARDFRRRVQLVHQNPGSSLNPRRTVAQHLAVPLRFAGLDARAVAARVPALLAEVELPGDYASKYPHELSGGQKQRVAIARALSVEPELLVLDEPTSALDVLVQERIVELLLRVREERGLTYLFISHDLGLMRNLCHRVAIMRRGSVCESGVTSEVFAAPAHPYTRALIASIPVVSEAEAAQRPRISPEERARVLHDSTVRTG